MEQSQHSEFDNLNLIEWIAIFFGVIFTLSSLAENSIPQTIVGIFLIWFGVSGMRHKDLLDNGSE